MATITDDLDVSALADILPLFVGMPAHLGWLKRVSYGEAATGGYEYVLGVEYVNRVTAQVTYHPAQVRLTYTLTGSRGDTVTQVFENVFWGDIASHAGEYAAAVRALY